MYMHQSTQKTDGGPHAQNDEPAGIRTRESAEQIVARARANSGLTDAEAMDLALRETTAERVKRS